MSEVKTNAIPQYRLPDHDEILKIRLTLAWLEEDTESRDYFRNLVRNQFDLSAEEFEHYDAVGRRASEGSHYADDVDEKRRFAIAVHGMSLMDPRS